MFPVNPDGNRNYALSHRQLSSNNPAINTGASQPNRMATVADNISFSTTIVGSMRLHVGKIITALSEYEKLLLSTVLAPDAEKTTWSAQPDENGIYSWGVDVSQYRSSHLLHDAPDQVIVTSALDSSLSCINRLMISDLSSPHSPLHCDVSFDWTENHHPEVSLNVVLLHPGQVNLQELVCLKEVMEAHTAMSLEGLQYPDNAIQHHLADPLLLNMGLAENINNAESQPAVQNQQTGTADYPFLVADEPVNEFAEIPSSHNVSPDIRIARQVSDESKVSPGEKATNDDERMISNNSIANKPSQASHSEIITHIAKYSGGSVKAILNSIREAGLSTNRDLVSQLVDDWRKDHPEVQVSYRRKKSDHSQIIEHIEKVAAVKKLTVNDVIDSLHEDDLAASYERVAPILRRYCEQRNISPDNKTS